MMTEWTAFALVALVTTVVALAVMAMFRTREDDGLSEEPADPWFGWFTPGIAGMVPPTESGRAAIRQDLYLAGHYQPYALENFLALRSLTTLVPTIGGMCLALFGPPEYFFWFLLGGIGLGVLGFAVPRVLLRSEGAERAERIRTGLPVLMDTMGLCLSTGASVTESFGRAGQSVERGYPDLAYEVRLVDRQADLRSLEHALDQWKQRIPLPELASFIFLLAQGERLGTDVTRGLWELSESYRVNNRQAAETAANRLNFTMLFPTVLCLMLSAAIVMAGPGFLQMVNEGNRLQQTLKDAEYKSQQLREESQKAAEKMSRPAQQAVPVPAPANPPSSGL